MRALGGGLIITLGYPDGSDGKESSCKAEDLGLIPGLGRSPGEGHGHPLQHSGWENPMNRGVHGILQARILEWVSISFSRESAQPRIEPRSPALQADSIMPLVVTSQTTHLHPGPCFRVSWGIPTNTVFEKVLLVAMGCWVEGGERPVREVLVIQVKEAGGLG